MVSEQKARDDVLRGFEIYNTKDMSVIGPWYDELLAPDCIYHNPSVPYLVQGREGIKQFVRELYKAIPDLHHNAPDDLIVRGDKVAVRYSVSRTDPDSGKRQTCMVVAIDHYAGDKIVAEWELVGPWEDEASG
jgi:predicted ester cyclase